MSAASEAAWRRFHEGVERQGGRVLEEMWLGASKRHKVLCSAGHQVQPVPSAVNRGGRICLTCPDMVSAAVEKSFRALMAERGWTVMEPSWLGAKRPHRAICAQGHETRTTPSSFIHQGTGCIICAGRDQGTAWREFCQLVGERGGTVLEPGPLGAGTPHRVRCPEGHEVRATPSYVRMGGGICVTCSPVSRVRAEQTFRDLVAALGGTLIEPEWLGIVKPHRVICSKGHETTPRPCDARRSGSICRVCSGHDSATSWQEFQSRVAEMGGAVVESAWLGNKGRHRVVCREGHECHVRPNNVQQGSSFCRTCAYKVWDVFYVVANDDARTLKFGITSHDPRSRLRAHRKNGFARVIMTIIEVPAAQDLENSVRVALQAVGMVPAKGREYFDIAALPTILDATAHWMAGDQPAVPQRP